MSDDPDLLLNELAEEFTRRCRLGERPPIREFAERHPELADEIRSFFPALVAIEGARPAAAPPAEPVPQFSQLGDYRIVREVGRGGMGVVYEAEQLSLRRRVALKVLSHPQRGLTQKRRFEQEARAAARLHHTNIVTVFGTGESGGTPYYVMQFIAGFGLDAVVGELGRLSRRAAGDPDRRESGVTAVASELLRGDLGGPAAPAGGSGRHPRPATFWEGAARIGAQVADALAYAHASGVVHRDIKPSNLLLDHQGTAWVTDFGLAKADGQEALTRTGDVLGTLRYMPPEAFEGRADARGDVYALGLTLYELLALRPAFEERDRARLVQRVLGGEVERLGRARPEVPRDLQTIVHKAIDPDARARYRGAAELADDLRRYLAGEPIRARRLSAPEQLARWARRNKGLAAGLAAAAGALVAVAAGSAIAAAHFRDLERAQRQLAEDNGRLAESNRALADRAELTLADMLAVQGLQAGESGDDRRAAVWFAQAALSSQADPERRRANTVRALAWAAGQSRPVAAMTHPDPEDAQALAFHPGNRHLISSSGPASEGQTVVWDLRTQRPLALPAGFGAGPLSAAAWSPDGTRVALADGGGRVGDFAFPALDGPRLVPAGDEAAGVLEYSDDGALLAVAWGQSARVWDFAAGRFRTPPLPHPGRVLSARLTPDGRKLVTTAADDRFRVWAVAPESATPELVGPHLSDTRGWTCPRPVLDPAGGRLVAMAAEDRLTWWDLANRRAVRTVRMPGASFYNLRDGPSGAIAAPSENGTFLFDRASAEPLGVLRPAMRASCLDAVWSPDGRTLVSITNHAEARTWDATEQVPRGVAAVQASGFRAGAASRDGTLLATAGYDSLIQVWAAADPDPAHFAVVTGAEPTRATFAPDSRHLLLGTAGGPARVHDAVTRSPAGPELRPAGAPLDAAWADGGRAVVTLTRLDERSGVLDFWDWRTGVRRRPAQPVPARPLSLASSAGPVAVLATGGRLRLFDAAGRALREWACHRQSTNVWLSADGRTAVTIAKDVPAFEVWDTETGKPRFAPRGHPLLFGATPSADGQRVVSFGADSEARVWDARTGARVGPALVHPTWVEAVDVAADGKTVLTMCKDRMLRVWDIDAGTLIGPPIPNREMTAPRLGPDGRTVLSVDSEGLLEVRDRRDGQRLLPPRRAAVQSDAIYTGVRTLDVSADGRRLAVGGRPNVTVFGLDALRPAAVPSVEELQRRAEVLSNHRVHEGGALANLTAREWLDRWPDGHARFPERPPDAAPPAAPAPPARLDAPAGRFDAAVAAARGDWLAAQGRWPQAAAEAARAAEHSPDDPESWVRLAPLLLLADDSAGYERVRQRLIARLPADPATLERLALCCLLRPGTAEQHRLAADAVGRALRVQGEPPSARATVVEALAFARLGESARASEALAAGRRLHPAGGLAALADAVEALVSRRANRPESAKQSLDRARALLAGLPPEGEGEEAPDGQDAMIARSLLQEAGGP